jgi:hypothetical protein
VGVASQQAIVFASRSHPGDVSDFLTDGHIFERVKVRLLGLELVIVVVFLFAMRFLRRLEDDESACPVPQGKESAGGIELESGDVVFLQQLLTFALVAK